MINIFPHNKISFDYVNWRGEKGHRKVEVGEFCFGSTEYHPEPQWLMNAYDLDKKAERTFALRDMSNVVRFE